MSFYQSGRASSGKPQARYAALAAVFAVLALVGCDAQGPDVVPVSGSVTLDGEPLAGARLKFQPEGPTGSPSYGTADETGRYDLGYKRGQPGALIGWHTVQIELGGRENDGAKETPRELPARYNVESELRREVTADGDNEFEFDLKSDPD